MIFLINKKMYLKNFDCISKRNHFYYEGADRHKNVPSAILTIIAYCSILYFSIVLLYNMLSKKSFTIYQNKSFLEKNDETSISYDPKDEYFFFHYLYIDSKETEGLLQIIGAYSSDDYYFGIGPVEYGKEKELDIYYYEHCEESDMYNYESIIHDKEIFL